MNLKMPNHDERELRQNDARSHEFSERRVFLAVYRIQKLKET